MGFRLLLDKLELMLSCANNSEISLLDHLLTYLADQRDQGHPFLSSFRIIFMLKSCVFADCPFFNSPPDGRRGRGISGLFGRLQDCFYFDTPPEKILLQLSDAHLRPYPEEANMVISHTTFNRSRKTSESSNRHTTRDLSNTRNEVLIL
jgi:hypothetical protein